MRSNHILGFLHTVSENPPQDMGEVNSYCHALGYGNPGKSLEYDDYFLLTNAPKPEVFTFLCRVMIDKYTRIWELMGKPENAHVWYNSRWNKSDPKYPKTRKMYLLKMAERFDIARLIEFELGINLRVFGYQGCEVLKARELIKVLETELPETIEYILL